MTKFFVEITDTFGGEANYSWVRRAPLESKKDTPRSMVQTAKAWAHLTGLRCKVENYGDQITIKPCGMCLVLFISIYDC